MKILYIITGLGMGGAETITVEIANKMQNRGHEVAILFLTGDNLQTHRLNQQIEVGNLGMKKNSFSFFQALYRAGKWVRAFAPDIVHSQMFHANLFSRCLRLFVPVPYLVCTEHTSYIGGKFRMFLYGFTDKLSNLNTNVSKEATSYFVTAGAFSKSKSITVYNGVDLSAFSKNEEFRGSLRKEYGIEDTDFLFLNVGRLVEAKDHVTLITAFSKLVQKGLRVKLLILGSGEEEIRLSGLIKEYSLSRYCILAGAHKEVSRFYNAADCFVLSSKWEGFPMVLIEAMASGLPVITTECGREAGVDYEYVVPKQDVDKLSEKMTQLYAMPQSTRISLGKRNRQIIKKFDIELICNQWEKIYRYE